VVRRLLTRRPFEAAVRTTVVLVLCASLGACHGRGGPSEEGPSPSASVVGIGVALGVCEDPEVCERECEGGSADRCRRLAATYAMGRGEARDEARAVTLYAQACEMKDAPACVFEGQMHEYAHGVPKDDARAAALYGRACDLGWLAGCYNLAIMLENGRGVDADVPRAVDLYERVCDAGANAGCAKARALDARGR
jgi:TPR repeat protein